ncbi:hypothetical protein GCM10009117_00180 [Gangjinia marincola]|uniref:Uncharacterized protein n=1 Tax=Gangjinia marincola TaxID=578463 RepID=A0ABP3XR65_9FLAO
MFKILQENPEIATLLIATTFTAVGFICKTLIDTFLENTRYKKVIKKAFWTEKLTAAKKTSEFYYEHLELIGLMIHQIDVQLEQGFSGPLYDSIQETIKKLSDRNANPQSFEHHHIHMFYDVDTKVFDDLNTESFLIIQQMEKIEFSETESLEKIEEKLTKVKGLLMDLKAKHEKKKSTYKEYLKKIREDISEFTK